MKHTSLLKRYLPLLTVIPLLFTSCINNIEESQTNSDNIYRLSVNINNSDSSRTIIPAELQTSEFTIIKLYEGSNKDNTEVIKTYTSDDEDTAYSKITNDSEIYLQAYTGKHYLKLELYYEENKLAATATSSVYVTTSTEVISVSFNPELAQLTDSSIDITFTWQNDNVTKADIYLYSTQFNTAPIKEVTVTTSLTEKTANIKASNISNLYTNQYYLKAVLYTKNTETDEDVKVKTYYDIVILHSYHTTQATIELNNINTLSKINYSLGDNAAWYSTSLTPQTIFNSYDTVELAAPYQIVNNNYKKFEGWYLDSTYTEESRVTEVSFINSDNTVMDEVTVYAKWSDNPDNTYYVYINQLDTFIQYLKDNLIQDEITIIILSNTSDSLEKMITSLINCTVNFNLDLTQMYKYSTYPQTEMTSTRLHLMLYLKSIVLPECTTTVSSELFYNCTALTSVTLSANVTTLGANFVNPDSYKINFGTSGTKWSVNDEENTTITIESATITSNDTSYTTLVTNGATRI